MRRTLLALTVLAACSPSLTGQARAASSYCSPTGDYCYSVKRAGGIIRLQFDTFSFSNPLKTCVRPPTGSRTCKTFKLSRRESGLMGFTRRWSAHFPRRGDGTYRVTYDAFGASLGPGVSFKL